MADAVRDILVIGASAGGIEAITKVLQPLPADLPAAIFVVQHIPPFAPSNLHRVLQTHTKLHAKAAEDGETIRRGTIYVARADRHLIVEEGRVITPKGPKENRFRPAIDALFRSAAYTYGHRVIGVVLSGTLNDGTSGMWAINRVGGVTIVQDPTEALFPDMPESVMQYTDVDYCLPAKRIGETVNALVRRPVTVTPVHHAGGDQAPSDTEMLGIEVEVAKGKSALDMGILEYGERSDLACPECHGALTQFQEGALLRYRCHTGHSHTAESLLVGINDNIEKSLWEVMRGMEESYILMDRLADQLADAGQLDAARQYRARAERIKDQSKQMQHDILANLRTEPGGVTEPEQVTS